MNELSIPKDLGASGEIAKGLHQPWLVAVWPGMGHVAISAGYYIMSKLGMEAVAEFSPRELFELNHVEVKDGLINTPRLPRSRFYLWNDPEKRHDIVMFIGEAQPSGIVAFCQALVGYAKSLGVERIFTFAAMATAMHPEHPSRVFVAATDQEMLDELKSDDLQILNEGHISGLNGVVLGEAAAVGMHGACLLGEMPHIFSQLPFPGASLSVVKSFANLAKISIDLDELEQQAKVVAERLGELLMQVEEKLQAKQPEESEEAEEETPEVETFPEPPEPAEPQLSRDDLHRIHEMFEQARSDKSKAYILKQELDRLGVFNDYEDEFLDLFQKPD